MPWRRPRPERRGMPRPFLRRHLHPPKPRRPGRCPRARWQEPARPAGGDRYSLFPPFLSCEGRLPAVTFALVAWPHVPRVVLGRVHRPERRVVAVRIILIGRARIA